MKSLEITRELNDNTRKQGLWINGIIFALHILGDEAIITDNYNYSKIYSIQTISMFNILFD